MHACDDHVFWVLLCFFSTLQNVFLHLLVIGPWFPVIKETAPLPHYQVPIPASSKGELMTEACWKMKSWAWMRLSKEKAQSERRRDPIIEPQGTPSFSGCVEENASERTQRRSHHRGRIKTKAVMWYHGNQCERMFQGGRRDQQCHDVTGESREVVLTWGRGDLRAILLEKWWDGMGN